MFNPTIGLYLYQVSIKQKRKKPYKASDLARPTWLDQVKAFQVAHAESASDEAGKRWYFESTKQLDDGFRAVVQYGRSGFGSRLLDGKSRTVNYTRRTSDIEVIPLVTRLWVPKTGSYGIWAFQSFGQYSCNNLILNAYDTAVRNAWKDTILDVRPIIPSYLKSYKSAPVTAVVLRKRTTDDIASRQIQSRSEVVNIDVKIAPPRGGILGKLTDVLPKFSGEKPSGRSFSGVEYDQAHATIDIGGHSRTVSLYGASRGTGLIDVDGDVEKVNGHPKRAEFFAFVDSFISDTVKELGIE